MSRRAAIGRVLKWPAIGALIGGGALLIAHLAGPSVAEDLGERAGEGFARGMAEAQAKIASLERGLSIAGWGSYHRAGRSS